MGVRLNFTPYCEECECVAKYKVKKIEQEVDGYFDDDDGNIQMKLVEVELEVDVCEEHLNKYLGRSYELVGTYDKLT